ncbi:hypothetical protein EQ718_09715 [Paracoccus versutus]|uniref:TRAP transporter TAXI family solute receptor n=1 Tax=Paracoccus versutus TaxID=34007 RepID=A0AAQ0HIP8_PARVE|nr:TAXI family TRAP transporter solute-binding subunit [Paracoccus versutus]KGJ08237.1 hypothetical protein IT40_18705 [Paracoccus versutus]REG46908.1 TRAP transporter TAXI family solute receptor [Paracoccus versutus]WEJ79133.1 hypothetical protein EQ718_09715 [Paracoccus versutus]
MFAAFAIAAGLGQAATAQEIAFFRIGTGGTAGTYYPIGGLIANAISNPPGSRACEEGGSCGVPGLVATALVTSGSVGNVKAIDGGSLEAGFSQSDVAYWAQTGTYEGQDADVATLSVGAQLVTSADQPEELVHGITQALYNQTTQRLLAAGHPRGRLIMLENATQAAGIPFHPGAERFYREAGQLE